MLLLAVLAGLVTVQLALRALRPHAWAGTSFASPEPAAALDGLVLDTGDPADLSSHRGDVVLLYFGYTWCPDVCPTTLSVAARAIESLGDDGERVHVYMITVDPGRDPLPDLGRYVDHFDPDFVGVGGAEADIAEVAALYGVYYQLQPPDENGNYLVDHTATLMGIDPNGNLKVLWDPTVTIDDLAADLRELL